MSPPPQDPTVTVVVRRCTRPGCEADFERTMQEFLIFAMSFPGNLGIHVLRSEEANPRSYTVMDRFADAAARREFTAAPHYQEWMVRLRELTVDDPEIQEMSGISGWFTLPDHPHPPPKVKMAVVTFLGVYPLTSVLPAVIGGQLPDWHPLLRNVLATGLIVGILTWVIMPALTRLLRRWLFPNL